MVAITANACIYDIAMIQLIEKQGNIYRLLIDGVSCLFIPMDLFTTGILPVKKCLVNNSLGYYVARKFVSYNKIKKKIQESKLQP